MSEEALSFLYGRICAVLSEELCDIICPDSEFVQPQNITGGHVPSFAVSLNWESRPKGEPYVAVSYPVVAGGGRVRAT